ncbi:MAG: RluA family pseudouridine synthase [Opitutaceae bacterium]|jgi:RluA family pseudouridine synthase
MVLPPVIFEDETIIAFDKPSGLPVSSDRWDKRTDTLMSRVREVMGKQVANVHRIDEGASGIVLCAKTKPGVDFLSGQFQSKTVGVIFNALVVLLTAEKAMKVIAPIRAETGLLPAAFDVELSMIEDKDHPERMRVSRKHGSKPGMTSIRTLEQFRGFAWVECNPHTGRRHQTRLHLAAAGVPVLNDPLYGEASAELRLSSLKRGYKGYVEEKPLIQRLALHAAGLSFLHPLTREPMNLSAGVPRDLEIALKYLRKFAAVR